MEYCCTDIRVMQICLWKVKVHTPGRIKKNSKRSTTQEVKASSFYWTQQSRGVSPTPSTCWMEGIFALRWPDWACYFRRAPLTTGWWDPAVCHEQRVNVNNLGCDPLSTSEP
jgi:hypothetical protein